MIDRLMTSDEWSKELGANVIDPDGWDRRNFRFSWYEEKISREEFDRRYLMSTSDHSTYSPSRSSS